MRSPRGSRSVGAGYHSPGILQCTVLETWTFLRSALENSLIQNALADLNYIWDFYLSKSKLSEIILEWNKS